MMKKTILLVVTFLYFTIVYSQSKDEEQIRFTLSDYIEGSSYNKLDQIKKAFADNATLYLTNSKGEFKIYTPQQYSNFFKNGEPGKFNGRVGKILDMKIENDIATASAEIVISSREARYIDLFFTEEY